MASTRTKKLGPYDVGPEIGRGGMGEVLKARHRLLERDVALKRLHADHSQDPEELKERFLREGRALAQLRHHNVVAVYDLFERRGELYLAMELVDGVDLATLLREGALPIDVACIIGIEVAAALEAAHRMGIVHRDIKAGNVMMSRDGAIKLMDFGIARQAEIEGVTRTGLVMGTPRYLAPELLQGQDADPRSDVYGLGALLYHCVSGRRLYEEATPENLFHLIHSGRYRPVRTVAPSAPRALRRLIEACLHRKPDKRLQSPSALRQGLEGLMSDRGGWANHAERVVGFLAARGRISTEEASQWVDASDLIMTSTFTESSSPGRRFLGALLMILFLVMAGAGAAAYLGLLDPSSLLPADSPSLPWF
ncbi:MAG: serine/threonine-protein kinase [Myxococcota bacterium]